MKLVIYIICLVTLNAAALIVSGGIYSIDLSHAGGLFASNVFLAGCFAPKYNTDKPGQSPAVFAASTFSALALIISIAWYLRLALVPTQFALAVEVVAVGLFLAIQVALNSARYKIRENNDPRPKPSDQEQIIQSSLFTIELVLTNISGAKASTTSAQLERIARQIRRKEIDIDTLQSPNVQSALRSLSLAASGQSDQSNASEAANKFIDALQG